MTATTTLTATGRRRPPPDLSRRVHQADLAHRRRCRPRRRRRPPRSRAARARLDVSLEVGGKAIPVLGFAQMTFVAAIIGTLLAVRAVAPGAAARGTRSSSRRSR